MSKLVPKEVIENKIFLIRGQRVMIDRDIAELYGVKTKYLNRQVRRNKGRFPEEFMFQLNEKEKNELVTNWHHLQELKYSYQLPYVFTEHGIAMLSSILNSKRAIKVSIFIIKTFIRLRKILSSQIKLAVKLGRLEKKVNKHDAEIEAIFDTIRQLMNPPEESKGKIGFLT
jgi:phage regulator Rha-like protein